MQYLSLSIYIYTYIHTYIMYILILARTRTRPMRRAPSAPALWGSTRWPSHRITGARVLTCTSGEATFLTLHVRVLPSFQQPAFQKTQNLNDCSSAIV